MLWHGVPGEVLVLARHESMRIFTSMQLLDEMREVICRAKFAERVQRTGQTTDELVRNFRAAAWLVRNRRMTKQVSRDPDDDAVLACAAVARADLIVSGDRDLLSLRVFRGIEIVSAQNAVIRFKQLLARTRS
ncbi:MAG: putative toxin-antitoxin system toxin component, PIN family [Betaproteobacteria bacterium RBG_16_66_20]|nr:MAG: putative toxin-antitoxin system toxin component, PIN family [Betaproteobacteria bacterium RBG_16_66_20]